MYPNISIYSPSSFILILSGIHIVERSSNHRPNTRRNRTKNSTRETFADAHTAMDGITFLVLVDITTRPLLSLLNTTWPGSPKRDRWHNLRWKLTRTTPGRNLKKEEAICHIRNYSSHLVCRRKRPCTSRRKGHSWVFTSVFHNEKRRLIGSNGMKHS